jgi:hypothetical protein
LKALQIVGFCFIWEARVNGLIVWSECAAQGGKAAQVRLEGHAAFGTERPGTDYVGSFADDRQIVDAGSVSLVVPTQ